MSFYKDQLVEWLREKDFKSGRVLSIGAYEDDRRYFKSFKCKEFKTLDIDPANKPDYVWDMQKGMLNEMGVKLRNYFDDIFTFELWEYIYEPVAVLHHCNILLNKGGRLWIAAPFLYPVHEKMEDDMLRYTESFWRKVLPETGFKIIEFEYRYLKSPEGWMASISMDAMRPSKRYNKHNISGFMIVAKKI